MAVLDWQSSGATVVPVVPHFSFKDTQSLRVACLSGAGWARGLVSLGEPQSHLVLVEELALPHGVNLGLLGSNKGVAP